MKTALSIVQKYYPNVTHVIDAKNNMPIRVTQNDCNRGESKNPSNCAMARAFKRIYNGAVISTSRAYLVQGNKAIHFTVPQSVARELVSFDRNHNFQPGSYELKAPVLSQRLGARGPDPDRVRTKEKKFTIKKVKHLTKGIRSL